MPVANCNVCRYHQVMLDIYTLGDDVLREECKDITEFGDAIRMLADAMIDTLDEADGVGLAGPQVGVSQNIFVVHIRGEKPLVFINPVITETSIETGVYEEGCLSIPGVYHDVTRPMAVTIQAQDVNGKHFTIKAYSMRTIIFMESCISTISTRGKGTRFSDPTRRRTRPEEGRRHVSDEDCFRGNR